MTGFLVAGGLLAFLALVVGVFAWWMREEICEECGVPTWEATCLDRHGTPPH